MLKCEIYKNILKQQVEIYIFDKQDYYIYDDGEYKCHVKKSYVIDGVKPCFILPYDLWEPIKEAFKKELDVEKIEGSQSHIKDLRWILTHFMKKDEK